MNAKKVAILFSLILITISFSGCSIRKAENNIPDANLKETENEKDIDSDNDGLIDTGEDGVGTNKNSADTDADGVSDFDEIKKWKTNPLNSDTDGDNYLDSYEIENGYNPAGYGQLDDDSDGLGNADEKKIGTDPNKFDTDDDGLDDKEEIDAGRDPLVAG